MAHYLLYTYGHLFLLFKVGLRHGSIEHEQVKGRLPVHRLFFVGSLVVLPYDVLGTVVVQLMDLSRGLA